LQSIRIDKDADAAYRILRIGPIEAHTGLAVGMVLTIGAGVGDTGGRLSGSGTRDRSMSLRRTKEVIQ
jgi:hypothetical protein